MPPRSSIKPSELFYQVIIKERSCEKSTPCINGCNLHYFQQKAQLYKREKILILLVMLGLITWLHHLSQTPSKIEISANSVLNEKVINIRLEKKFTGAK